MSFEIVFKQQLKQEKQEAETLKGYYYEYFITRIGAAPFRGYGSSIKKSATDTGNDGMAYRIYGCGIKALGMVITKVEINIMLVVQKP